MSVFGARELQKNAPSVSLACDVGIGGAEDNRGKVAIGPDANPCLRHHRHGTGEGSVDMPSCIFGPFIGWMIAIQTINFTDLTRSH